MTVSLTLEIKLASLVVHAQEALSSDGHEFDGVAIVPIVQDPEVQEWLDNFDPALLPLRRNERKVN